ncbi:hypothetical protein PIB30_071238 [Stylosanthes scabra]|uniref:Uncharacterized protein n=1 Tax=Stylosanthes scabra TaxID=79078 RepID=A0ABU6SP56_9FABA|nr:hypothetical protein [Stylosanthes scabra]
MRDANANLVQEYVQSGCVTKGEEMMIGTPIGSSDKKPKDQWEGGIRARVALFLGKIECGSEVDGRRIQLVAFSDNTIPILVTSHTLAGNSLYMFGEEKSKASENHTQRKLNLLAIQWEHHKVHDRGAIMPLFGVKVSHESADAKSPIEMQSPKLSWIKEKFPKSCYLTFRLMALSDGWSYREYLGHAHMRHLNDNQEIANSMNLTLFNWIGKYGTDKGQLIARNMNLMERKIRDSIGVLHFKQWDLGKQREEGSNKGHDLFIKEVKSICSITGSIWNAKSTLLYSL